MLLRRQIDSGAEENGVQAFNVVCPHAGCFVRFNAERNQYVCPCHNSAFELDGQVIADPVGHLTVHTGQVLQRGKRRFVRLRVGQ